MTDDSMNTTNKRYFVSLETLQTIVKGAIGAMTFGAYHQFNTNKILDMQRDHNENQMKNLKEHVEQMHQNDMTILEYKHRSEMEELKRKMEERMDERFNQRWF